MVNFPGDDAPIPMSFSILLLFLLQLLCPMQVCSYVPDDSFAVSCGNPEKTRLLSERNWVGDIGPKSFSIIEPNTVHPSLIADTPSPIPLSEEVPYGTVRLFRSRFTYSFPLKSNGPKFVRLHFYPTTYLSKFEPYNSLFSVVVGNFTLLEDFNASRWLLDDEKTVSKEYCINVEAGQRLNLTFIPSTDRHPDAYAFINGIEVVSMPPFLYYTNLSKDDPGFEQVGSSTILYKLESKRALETLYRVTVGGNRVPPADDTGMFRDWEPDYPRYLEVLHPNSIQTVYKLHLNYTTNTIPNYTAPETVYLSARSYGLNARENYNVTWNFEVDTQFFYMVRLHFCVWADNIQKYGDMIFQIFIADIMAEERADVIGWSGGNLVPTYRDYAVSMSTEENSSKRVKLSIKLQRKRKGYGTKINDVILNGIEVFKISDDKNLAGPNPDPGPSPPQLLQPSTQPSKGSKKTTVGIIIAVVAVSSLMLASLIGVIVFKRRGRGLEVEGSTKKPEGSSSLPSHLCRSFTIAEIRAATQNFDDAFIIGVGGFGNVYKGYIDGSTPVAIKRLKPGSQQGLNEFLNEIEMLFQLRHLHLVSLIGYCNDGTEMILVYDFMQRGTLREYLYGSDNKPLPWKKRLEILLGAARGLHYLHTGAKHNIIHRDVKSTNILLDEKWVAKVSDFGLSKVGPTGTSTTHVSTIVKGSLGYLDPEYYKRQRLTLKSDVYSFGVVLLEVLCARPPLVRDVDKRKASVVDWVRRCHDEGKLDQTVDPFLKDSITRDGLKWYGQMALSCLRDDGNQRPSMSDVVGALEFAMQLADTDDDVGIGGTQAEEKTKSEQRPLLAQYTSEEGSDVLFTTTDESGSKDSKVTTVSASSEEQHMLPAAVFSEIADPKAR